MTKNSANDASGLQTSGLKVSTLTPDGLLHSRDAARYLGVSEAWLARERWKGTGPAYIKVGGASGRAVRYRHSDLMVWIERNLVCAANR